MSLYPSILQTRSPHLPESSYLYPLFNHKVFAMSYTQNDELKTYLAQKAAEFIAASRNHDTQPPSSPSGSGFSLEADSQIAASAPPMLEDTDPELQAVIDQAVVEVSPY